MPNNDSHQHVVKTSAQWNERIVEFWVVPRGCLCVELTSKGKTKIKIGEGDKYYSQLPYICNGDDLSQYYTKEEVNNLFDNFNRMAIMSTDEYDRKADLPMTGNKLGDVRFVKSSSPSVTIDPDIYLWNGRKWIYVGNQFPEIDLNKYLKKTEFHELFDPVKERVDDIGPKVDEMYPMRHTHANKDILDNTTASYTSEEKTKLAGLHNYDVEISDLQSKSHTHDNKTFLDTITQEYQIWSQEDRYKFDHIKNYDQDIAEIRVDIQTLESIAHTHGNKNILDQVTAAFTVEDKTKLDSLHNDTPFVGTDGMYPGVEGNVPAPLTTDVGKFLSSDGTWRPISEASDFIGATDETDGYHGLVPAPLAGEETYYLRGDGTWAKVKQGGDKYKAGDGIYILSGESASTTFPFNVYAKSNELKEYIIYGSSAGTGDYDSTTGTYRLTLTVSAEDHPTVNFPITLGTNKLFDGDYISFERSVFVHYKTNLLTTDVKNASVRGYIDPTGREYYSSSSTESITPFIEVSDQYSYEFDYSDLYAGSSGYYYYNVNLYDESKQRTRTVQTLNVPYRVRFTPTSTEKYIRLSATGYNMGSASFLYQLGEVEEPISGLPTVSVYGGTINTIDVSVTNKPREIYVEVAEDESPTPDPSSEFTGIIYNEGVLDVTQEDPNAMNELTVHFRESTKVLTIPDTYILPPATTSTLGGVIVGDGLEVDQNGVLDTIPYEAGVGLSLGTPYTHNLNTDIPETYLQVEYLESTGTQYMNLGSLATDNYAQVTIDFSITHIVDDTWIAGNGNSWYSYYRGLGMLNGALRKQDQYVTYDPDTLQENLRVVGSFTVDESYQAVYAFARSGSNGIVEGYSQCRIYNLSSIETTGSEPTPRPGGSTRNMYPCIRKLDNVPGLYDTVNDVFYTNDGTGDFLYGDPLTVTDYLDGNTFNVNIGEGLEVDNNNDINVKLGSGLAFDANGAIEATGGGGGTTYQAGEGINITSDATPAIEAKLGVGLTFDQNDAITLDESIQLILNCNFNGNTNNSPLGTPVNAPGSGTQMNTSIMGDLTVLEV